MFYNWTTQLAGSCAGPDIPEIAHAALISTGHYAGMVLLWKQDTDSSCFGIATTTAWIFDPAAPTNYGLVRVEQTLASEIFCGGQSWDKNGQLLVAGGFFQATNGPPEETYRFRPSVLGAPLPDANGFHYAPSTVSAWLQLSSMDIPRYYPTLMPVDRRGIYDAASTSAPAPLQGGSNLVLGGPPRFPPSPQLPLPFTQYNDFWEVMRAHASAVTSWYPPVVPRPQTNSPNVPDFVSGAKDEYKEEPNELAVEERLESYPRAFQLSTGDILVSGDVDSYTGNSVNAAGRTCVMKPRYDLIQQSEWRLHEGTHPSITQPNLWRDSYYDSVVLLHQLAFKDRVIAFGGSRPSGVTCSPTGTVWEMNQDVWELNQPTTAPNVEERDWSVKLSSVNFQRIWANAVVLPTGEVLVDGGSSTDSDRGHCCSCPGGHHPVSAFTAPVIYEPGHANLGGAQGSLQTAHPQNIARLYHHVSVLLPDGRVFIAGGEHVSTGQNSAYTAEIFYPPYLTSGVGYRPVLIAPPTAAAFSTASSQQTITLSVIDQFIEGTAQSIDRVVLLHPAAVTHHFDNDQRYIELEVLNTQVMFNENEWTTGIPEITWEMTVAMPDEKLGPPGWYMLFAVENDGSGLQGHRVPSVGSFIQIL